MSRPRFLDPDGREISRQEWSRLFGARTDANDSWWRRVTTLGDVVVSTVWGGLNQQWGDGAPLYWETMIFGDEYDEWQWRWPSRDAAFAGHDRIAAALRDGNTPEGE